MAALKGWTEKYMYVEKDKIAYYEKDNKKGKSESIPFKDIADILLNHLEKKD
jgi:hypothetical protein